MTKKKKKSSNILVQKAEEKQLNSRFLERITFIAKAMVGEAVFKLIPSHFLQDLVALRVPVLKAKAAPGSDILKSRVVQYNKLFTSLINEHTIETDFGVEIPISWYFTEGIVLLDQIWVMVDTDFRSAALVKEAFKQYLPESDHYNWMGNLLNVTINDANVMLSEPDKHGIIYSDISDTIYINQDTVSNSILIDQVKPEKTRILIDNVSRVVIKLGWIFAKNEWIQSYIKPAQIGFSGDGDNIPLPLYIQQHAIDQLQKRVDITPGIMFFAIIPCFIEDCTSFEKGNNHSKVAYYLAGQKIGYLVCNWCNDKIVIVTFLFLTNDGTPEGKKLEKILALEKADKQYLKIDTLPHFNSYHFENDKSLSAIFTAAGCDSLFKLGKLQEFSKRSVADKDPESIKKYISDFSIRQQGFECG